MELWECIHCGCQMDDIVIQAIPGCLNCGAAMEVRLVAYDEPEEMDTDSYISYNY